MSINERKLNEEREFSFSWQAVFISAAAVFFFAILSYFIFKPLCDVGGKELNIDRGVIAEILLVFMLAVCGVYAAICAYRKKLTINRIIIVIFVAAMALRLRYFLVTVANCRQYDTFSSNFNGHEGYAYTIYESFTLPDNNSYQFYHPPLNAFIQALFMNFSGWLTSVVESVFGMEGYFAHAINDGMPSYLTAERYYLYSTCQILSYFYSYLTLVVAYKILKTVGLSGKNLAFWFGFFAFFPRNIMFAATLNNDPLAYLNSMAAIYFALKWWISGKKLPDILLCGLFIGLGISSKLSAATVCLPIGAVFVYEFVRSVLKADGALDLKKIIVRFVLFLVVTAPLSLAFIIYAKVRFDQPVGFVFGNLNKALATDHHSVFERLFITFDKTELLRTLYIRNFVNYGEGIYNNYNILNYTLRSAVFGEFSYWRGEGFAVSALFSELVLFFSCVAAIVGAAVHAVKNKLLKSFFTELYSKEDNKRAIFGAVLSVTLIISFVAFYLKMPFSCTMDFRYIMPLIICTPLIFAGLDKFRGESKFLSFTGAAIKISGAVFVACSAGFYTLCI